jgi:hypothetical protein
MGAIVSDNGTERRCLNCKWVSLQTANMQVGECHFNPPTQIVAGMTPNGPAIAPVPTMTPLAFWCSHFETGGILVPNGMRVVNVPKEAK